MIPKQKISKTTFSFVLIASVIGYSKCCQELELPCKNGDCLDGDLFCDGEVNCLDGSDEIADACIAQECSHFTFRCAYGACISQDARCNGTFECADKSDEDHVMCGYKGGRPKRICSKDEFQCDSGECINEDLACDGQANCPDQSDESVKHCASTFCPDYAFKCGNGACIEESKKCNGKPDCFDKSDEGFELCGRKPNDTIVTTPPPELPFECTAPNINNSRLVYEFDSKIIKPGDKIPQGVSILYKCANRYNLEGREINFCFNGSWYSSVHPICTRYCQHEVLKGITFTAICTLDGATVPCNNRIKPGTVANILCSNKYRVPDHNPPQSLRCQDDGEWDYQPSRCEPICGEEYVPSRPFMVHGEPTSIKFVPWHVGVYHKRKDNKYEHHCGGSIINTKVVISAAHCFWDKKNGIIYDNSLFTVGAGKYYRDYYTDEPGSPQFRNVSKIAIPTNYMDEAANYNADLAVIVLTTALIFSEVVAPICIHWEKDGAKSAINGLYGQVAGWGRDESGGFSEELRTILVSASSYEVCRNQSRIITDDKFCVWNNASMTACEGDSGGGFTVSKTVGPKNIYYLWGVVSTGQPYGAKCKFYEFNSYTNIQFHDVLIKNYETSNRPK